MNIAEQKEQKIKLKKKIIKYVILRAICGIFCCFFEINIMFKRKKKEDKKYKGKDKNKKKGTIILIIYVFGCKIKKNKK